MRVKNEVWKTSVVDVYGDLPTLGPKENYLSFRFPRIGDVYITPEGKRVKAEQGDTRPAGPRIIIQVTDIYAEIKALYGTENPALPARYNVRLPKVVRPLQIGEVGLAASGCGRPAVVFAEDTHSSDRYLVLQEVKGWVSAPPSTWTSPF